MGIYSSVLLAFMIFMVGMTVVNFIMPEVTQARTDASCSSPSTDGGKLLCLVLDTVVIYFMLLVLSISGGLILDKLLI